MVVLWHCSQVCGKPDVTWFGVRRSLEIGQVASDAGGRCQVVVIIDVALRALQWSCARRSAGSRYCCD